MPESDGCRTVTRAGLSEGPPAPVYAYDETPIATMHFSSCSFSVAFWNHYKFTGKERDAESGLDNFGKRYDSSSMGRFMTPDPLNIFALKPSQFRNFIVNPQHWNKYAYVLNNPITFTDPLGLLEYEAELLRKKIHVHIDDQTPELLGRPLDQSIASRPEDVAPAGTRTEPDEPAAFGAIRILSAADFASPRIGRRITRSSRAESIVVAAEIPQPPIPEGAIIITLAKNDRFAHRRSSSI